jgi:hypothetical protein
VLRKIGLDGHRQHPHPVPGTHARTHHDLVRCEVDVFHAQPRPFQHAESRPVQEERQQTGYARELAEDGSNLFAAQDDRQTPGALRVHDAVQPRDLLTKHLAVQEQQRAQRLVLGGGRHLSLNGERRQELCDLGCSHLRRMTLPVKQDMTADPRDVRLFRAAL